MIVRSKIHLLYDALESKKGIISPEIQSIKRNIKSGNYEIEIFDRLKVERQDPAPGSPIFIYQFLRKRVKTYSPAQISQLFDLFGSNIIKGENDFDPKFIGTLPEALLFTSNTTSIYGSLAKTPEEILNGAAGAFELIDESLEIQPDPDPAVP
ncbi:hypothetical protein JM79_3220 [Gramella sp. Hel_I_59]|uniref:hypothetical protein n=1 Tax=Gramella sp. Hel_I_59 TaxID=1249978 RepID=UPI001151AF0E|nr:hypothetical protein [Gramella sp. Hel_I_59]TQI72263.1 hypothetical protein JM79_3220 [Gramella sp. Hel_I_59]